MKRISDRDLGIPCNFVAQGDTDEEVLNTMTSHIKENHPEEYDKVRGMMRSKIHET